MEINRSFYILLLLYDNLDSSLSSSSKENDGGKSIKRKIKLKKIISKKSKFKSIISSKNKDNAGKTKSIILLKKKDDSKKSKFINFPQNRDNAAITIEINIIIVVISFISGNLTSDNKNLR